MTGLNKDDNFPAEVKLWEKAESGFIAHFLNGQKRPYSLEELTDIDPRLPLYLLRAACYQTLAWTIGVDGTSAAQTKDLWEGNCFRLTATGTKPMVALGLYAVSIKNDIVNLRGWFKEIGQFQTDSGYIEYLKDKEHSVIQVKKEWLDQNYGEWFKRWGISEGIGLLSNERLSYVLDTSAVAPPQKTASLDGIDF